MREDYRQKLEFAIENGRFDEHPNDWDRFYAFVVAVAEGDESDRVLNSELQEALRAHMPGAVDRINEMVTAYTRGLDLLSYMSRAD